MLLLDGAFLYALMVAEFQEIPTVRPDGGLAHMREKTLCCDVCSADTDSAIRCEQHSVSADTDSAVRCEQHSVSADTDSAVRCEHSTAAVQTLTVPSGVNTAHWQCRH
jgi:hypothetical protein